MRLLWLPFCCLLAGAASAQADAYRDKDEGFNPLDVMQGMPNPMNMFDASERRRQDRFKRPPPPRVPPGYPYPPPAPPAYRVPPGPAVPYYSGRPAIPQQTPPSPAQSLERTPDQGPPGSAASPQPDVRSQPRQPPAADTAQPAYRFRPMTPEESTPQPAMTPTDPEQTTRSTPVSPSKPSPRGSTATGTTLMPPYAEQEPPMINGKPAIFRPLDQGVEEPPTQ
jgi:hypothetical protein